MALNLHSEPFGPDGNLSAEGFERLLGTPGLNELAVLVREAVQNSCDATLPDPGEARVLFRIRELVLSERDILEGYVFREMPEGADSEDILASVLARQEPLRVLEIADFGTTGLGGPTRADRMGGSDDQPDFVNFFRNIGAARDVEGGGGTYGYGKATLYRASRAHAIIVDTSAEADGCPVRRFMAAKMGRPIPGRFTGRHWWGEMADDGRTVEPVVGEKAALLAEGLGMPPRAAGSEGMGTTIMILDPRLPANPRESILAIQEYLLWFFWPRMMRTAPKGKRLCATVSVEGEDVRVPFPEDFPPLDLMCRAMRTLDEGSEAGEGVSVEKISMLSPKRMLGRMAIAEGMPGMRKWLLPPAEGDAGGNGLTSIFPESLRHVALMRPARMVVKYLEGSERSGREWGGVFMCSGDPEIEGAFAKAEPPAHDDWQPESLPARSFEKRCVNVALRRIRERLAPSAGEDGAVVSEDVSLARAARLLGRYLYAGAGNGAAPGNGGGGGSAGLPPPVSAPRAAGLIEDAEGRIVAEFAVDVSGNACPVELEAEPRVLVEGKLQMPDESTGVPEILGWVDPDGTSHAGRCCTATIPGTWKIRALVPGEVAVGVRVRVR